ncbi:MAG TPA: PD-(D/E)XK nuclease domain-containing protein, partial [Candidatus Deferrimicrobium sp.]|nr:PD-(D/E)XK nuclease domain-containing protein [Candidatus Deferrimicrobium sp.]
YSWNGKDFVYNPFSINNFFDNMEFKNYWFASGTTTSLVKWVKKKNIAVENWEYLEVQEQFFDKFDVTDLNINLMLFQTGYLTVKKRLEDTYVLSYPNREVEHALLNNLMEVYSGHSQEDTEKLIKEIKDSLAKKQLAPFIHQMKAFIASIPYNLVEADVERFYHLVFYLVLKLLIGKAYPEKCTNLGRIDTVVETGSFIYIFEFKMGSADEAFKQILEKKYYEQYLARSKTIILLGIGFSVKDRNISGYKTIEVGKDDLPGDIDKRLAEETGAPEPPATPSELALPGSAWPGQRRMNRVVIIYSHQDEKWKDRLAKQLEVLELQDEIDAWDDRRIAAGDDWLAGITGALNEAEVAVLLISADFLTSGFIREHEVPVILQRRADENMKIFSLIARPCPWSHVPWLSTFQARPGDGKTLSETSKPKREKILTDFALEIKNILPTFPGKNKKK